MSQGYITILLDPTPTFLSEWRFPWYWLCITSFRHWSLVEIRGYCCLTNIWDTIWWIPWCLRNTPSRGQKSPLSIPGLWLVIWPHAASSLAAQVSSWNVWHHGTGLPGQAVTRNYNGDQFSRELGKWGREDLWSWYKLSSDAWANYQWSCAWPPVDIFKKLFLHCYFLFQVSSYILFYCSLLGALFYWIKERESFLQSAAICSAVIMQWCGICSFAKMFSSSFHFAWCQYHAASALQWQNDNAI